jgi:5-methylcytosine-specific restriction endonuclease McrA
MPKGRLSARESELRSKCASGKRRFRTEEQAQRALDNDIARREAGNVQRRERRVYQCAGDYTCGGFHLTSQPMQTAPRTAISPVSVKRAIEQRQRTKMLREVFGTDPLCVRCGQPADDAHEVLSRARGGSIVSADNVIPLCRPCHNWVTTHPLEAEAEGWSRSA